jgi:hypothetical protein
VGEPPPEEGTIYTLAYLDAGSGSMLVQAVAGGVAAAGVVTKLYWRRIKSFLRAGGRNAERQPEP